jgi:hypothetical protein
MSLLVSESGGEHFSASPVRGREYAGHAIAYGGRPIKALFLNDG